MKDRGWRSRDTLAQSTEELLRTGWVVRTRQGGRNRTNLYALTFHAIDECGGKLDRAATCTAPGYWKTGANPEYLPNQKAAKN